LSRSFIPDPTVSATPDPTSELAALAAAWIGASLSLRALLLAVLRPLLLLLLLLMKKKRARSSQRLRRTMARSRQWTRTR
jgi:hypothetical protein